MDAFPAALDAHHQWRMFRQVQQDRSLLVGCAGVGFDNQIFARSRARERVLGNLMICRHAKPRGHW